MLFPRHILQSSEPKPDDYFELERLCDALLKICYDTTQDYLNCSFEELNQCLFNRCYSCDLCNDEYFIELLQRTTNAARYKAFKPYLTLYVEDLDPTDPQLRKKMLFLTAASCIRERYSYKLIKAQLYALTKPIGHTTLFFLF